MSYPIQKMSGEHNDSLLHPSLDCDVCHGYGVCTCHSPGYPDDEGPPVCCRCEGSGDLYIECLCGFVPVTEARSCVCCRLEYCATCECACFSGVGCDCKRRMVTESVRRVAA